MHDQYIGILVLVGVAALLCGAMVTLSWVLGPKKNTPYKSSPYECGVAPLGDARERFPIKFYLVAIVFILFDIEVVFLWAWMTVYRNGDLDFKTSSLIYFLSYMVTWILAYAYMIRVNAIDWDDSDSISAVESGHVSITPQEHSLVGVGGGTK